MKTDTSRLRILTLMAGCCFLWIGGSAAAQSSDDWYAEVAKRVPQFAGLLADRDQGGVVILVTERYVGLEDALRKALTEVLPSNLIQGRDLNSMTLEDAQYSFLQLKEWHDRLFSTVFGIEGVTLSSIDTRANRVAIAVQDLEKQGPQVEAEVERYDIPREAVVIRAGGVFESTASLPQPNTHGLWWGLMAASVLVVVGATWAIRTRGMLTDKQVVPPGTAHSPPIDRDVSIRS